MVLPGQLEDAVLEFLMENFNMAQRSVVWGPVTVESNTRKMMPAEFEVRIRVEPFREWERKKFRPTLTKTKLREKERYLK